MKKRSPSTTELEKLAKDLSRCAEKDQEMRRRWAAKNFDIAAYDKNLDRENTKLLKTVVRKIGWPRISEVGRPAALAAWLLLQHSPDIKFRHSMLGEMKKLPAGEIEPIWLAQTIDRVRIKLGQKQLYGTAYVAYPEKGELVCQPIHNEKNLDKRRLALGLSDFQTSHREVLESFNKQSKEKGGDGQKETCVNGLPVLLCEQ